MVVVHLGDCRAVVAELADASVHAVVCDPPYELGFMGRGWDSSGVAYDVGLWREVLRVLQPGGHLVAFGATRTYHRLACAIEDAGFEIRDCVAWLHGMGFPKSRDVAKELGAAWQGWGTALKPAFEPAVLARAPLVGTVAANVRAFGVGALNVGACRLAAADAPAGRVRHGGGSAARATSFHLPDGGAPMPSGRWPANVAFECTCGEVVHAAGCALAVLEAQCAGAARFFYAAKATAAERERGLVGAQVAERVNVHTTVKPLDLMRWLCRLVTPPGGTVLDPFTGSGTTGMACVMEGFDFIGVELQPEYHAIALARIAATQGAAVESAKASRGIDPLQNRAARANDEWW
jgi:hypothetical protein